MATMNVDLTRGLTIGEKTHTTATIREATAADLIDATDESEKIVKTPDGYQLIASPTQVGLNTLRRQIVSVGDYKGPLSMAELKKLSATDLSLLQETAQAMDAVSMAEITDRGRD
jgi:phage FluMu protein gp41